jgi:hypothetical protein
LLNDAAERVTVGGSRICSAPRRSNGAGGTKRKRAFYKRGQLLNFYGLL